MNNYQELLEESDSPQNFSNSMKKSIAKGFSKSFTRHETRKNRPNLSKKFSNFHINDAFFSGTNLDQLDQKSILTLNIQEYCDFLSNLPIEDQLTKISLYLEWYLSISEAYLCFNQISWQTDFFYKSIVLSPNGKKYATQGFDFCIEVCSFPEKQLLLRMNQTCDCRMQFSYDASFLALLKQREGLILYDTENNAEFANFNEKISLFSLGNASNKVAFAKKEGFQFSVYLAQELLMSEFQSDKKEVQELAFSCDDELLCTASADGVIYIWNLSAKTLQNQLETNSSEIYSLAFSPNGNLLAFGANDRAVTLWPFTESRTMNKLHAHRKNVTRLFFEGQGNQLASLDENDFLVIWNVAQRKQLAKLQRTNEVQLSSAVLLGNELLTVGVDLSFNVWDVRSGKLQQDPRNSAFYGEIDTVVRKGNEVAFSYDGKILAKVNNKPNISVNIWETSSGNPINSLNSLPNDQGYIRHMCFSRDNQLLALCFQGFLLIFDVNNPQEPLNAAFSPNLPLEEPEKDRGSFTFLAFSEKNDLCAGTSSGSLCLWTGLKLKNFEDSKKIMEEHVAPISFVRFSLDGGLMASGDDEGKIRVWDVAAEGKLIGKLDKHQAAISCLLFYKDSKKLISAAEDQVFLAWSLDDSRILCKFGSSEPENIACCLDLNEKETRLLAGYRDGCLEGFKIEEKNACSVHCWKYHVAEIANARFLNDDQAILSQSAESVKSLRLNNRESPQIFVVFRTLAVSRDAKLLVSLEEDEKLNRLCLHSLEHSQKSSKLPEKHAKPVSFCVFSEDGRFLLSVADNELVVWDPQRGDSVFEALQFEAIITKAIFFKDILVLGSTNGELFLIELEGKQRSLHIKRRVQAHSKEISAMDVSFNGFLATAGKDFSVFVWSLPELEKVNELTMDEKKDVSSLQFSLGGCYLFVMTGMGNFGELKRWTVEYGQAKSSECVSLREQEKICNSFCLNLMERKIMTFVLNEQANSWTLQFVDENLDEKSAIDVPLAEFDGTQLPLKFLYSGNGDLVMIFARKVLVFRDFYKDEEIFIKKIVRIASFFEDPAKFCSELQGKNEIYMHEFGKILPFGYNILHVIAYTNDLKGKFSEILGLLSGNGQKLDIKGFFEEDLHGRTPFDILFLKKNRNLLQLYLEYFFENFTTEEAYYVGFFRYLSPKHLNALLELFYCRTEFINKMFDYFFATPIDLPIKFLYKELENPLYITANGPVLTKQKLEKILEEKKAGLPESQAFLPVKAKCLFLPCLIDKNIEETNEFFGKIADLGSDNAIYKNNTLTKILEYKWELYGRRAFIHEIVFFLALMLVYIVNNGYLLPYRVEDTNNGVSFSDSYYQISGLALNIVTYILLFFYLKAEIVQMNRFGFRAYFTNIWNWFDIPLSLILVVVTVVSVLNILNIGGNKLIFTKNMHAFGIFFFFLRLLSFARGFKGTCFITLLLIQCFNDIRYFFSLMFLFIVGLAFSMHAQQTEFSMSHFEVFDAFFRLMLGDADGYDDLDTVSSEIQYFYFTVASIILTVSMLNMLISIISETFAKVKEAEKMTRNYELLAILAEKDILAAEKTEKTEKTANIIGNNLGNLANIPRETENNTRNMTKIMANFFGNAASEPNKYLIYIYNEQMEDDEVSQLDELQGILEKQANTIKEINEIFGKLKETVMNYFKENQSFNEENFKKLEFGLKN